MEGNAAMSTEYLRYWKGKEDTVTCTAEGTAAVGDSGRIRDRKAVSAELIDN